MLEKSFLLPYPHTRACIAFGPKGGDARGHGTAVHGVANICRRGVYRYALHSMQILMPIVSDSAAEAKPVGLTDGDAGEAAGVETAGGARGVEGVGGADVEGNGGGEMGGEEAGKEGGEEGRWREEESLIRDIMTIKR